MVGNPQRSLRDLCGKFFDLDAVKIIDIDQRKGRRIEKTVLPFLFAQMTNLFENIEFEQTHFAVCNHQKKIRNRKSDRKTSFSRAVCESLGVVLR